MNIFEISELDTTCIKIASTSISEALGLPDDPDAPMSITQRTVADQLSEICKIMFDVSAGRTKRFYGAVEGEIPLGEFPFVLKGHGINFDRESLFEWMRENGWIEKGAVLPTDKDLDTDFLGVEETIIHHIDGSRTTIKVTKVTEKGQQYFINLFLDKDAA